MIKISKTSSDDVYHAFKAALPTYNDGYSLNTLADAAGLNSVTHTEHGVLAVLHIAQMFRGAVEVSAVLTTNIHKCPVEFVRYMRRSLVNHMQTMNIHRVQITVKADYKTGQDFATALGFTLEGTMHKYGPDQSDYLLFGKVL